MNLQSYIATFIVFVEFLVQFLIGIAFVIFVINVVRLFMIDAANDDSRQRAKRLALYGVLAFVLFVILWGVINLLAGSSGLSGCSAPESDYFLQNFVGPMQPDC